MKDFKSSRWNLAAPLVVFISFNACRDSREAVGGLSTPVVAPKIMSTTPPSGATGVPPNGNASVTFSEAMAPGSLNATTFTLTSGVDGIPVPGTVIYDHGRVVFWPTAYLPSHSSFTATITTGATSASGTPIAAKHVWTFSTGNDEGLSALIHARLYPQTLVHAAGDAEPSLLSRAPKGPLDRSDDLMDGYPNRDKR